MKLKILVLVLTGVSLQCFAGGHFSTFIPPVFTVDCRDKGCRTFSIGIPVTIDEKARLAGYVVQVNEAMGYLNEAQDNSSEETLSPVLQEAIVSEKTVLTAEKVDTSQLSNRQILESFVNRALRGANL